MRIRRLVLGKMIVFLLLGSGHGSMATAGEPAWWTQQKRACGLPPALAYNSWNGRCGADAATPPAPAVDAETIRLNELNGRFNALLSELRPYPVPNVSDLYTASPPATFEELSRRVDRLYVETAFHKSRRYWQYEENLRNLARFPAVLTDLRADIVKLELTLATAPERLRKAEAARDRHLAKAKAEEHLAQVLRNNVAIVAGDLWSARGYVLWPVHELLPTERKAAFHAGMRKGEALPVYAKPMRPEPTGLPANPVQPAKVVGRAVNLIGPMHKPSPLAGSVAVRLQAFDDLKSTLSYVNHLMPSQETRLTAFGGKVRELRQQEASLLARLQAYESPLEKVQAEADGAERRLLAAQFDQKASAASLLRLAAATVVWNHLKTSVVLPRIEQVLKQNGLLRGVKGVALLDQIRRNPQEFLPKWGPLKDQSRLIETAKKVLSVEENMESFALAAANASAQRGTTDSEVLVAHVFSGLGRQGTDIMRTASDGMEGPLGKIAHLLMERAP